MTDVVTVKSYKECIITLEVDYVPKDVNKLASELAWSYRGRYPFALGCKIYFIYEDKVVHKKGLLFYKGYLN